MSLRRPLWAAREAWRALSAPLAGAQEDFVQAEGLLGSLEMRLPILEVAPFAGVAVPEPEEAPGVAAVRGAVRPGGAAGAGAGASRGGRAGVGLPGQQRQQRQQGQQGQQGRPERQEWERQPEREGRESPPGAPAAPAAAVRAAEAGPVPRLSLRRPGVGGAAGGTAKAATGAAAAPEPVASRPAGLLSAAPFTTAPAVAVTPAPVTTAGDLLAELTRELWTREMPAASSGARGPHPPTPSPITPLRAHTGSSADAPKRAADAEPSPPDPLSHTHSRPPGRGGATAQNPETSERRVPPLPGGWECGWERGLGGEGPGGAGSPALPDPDEARRLADLVNEALVEQARRHGVDLS